MAAMRQTLSEAGLLRGSTSSAYMAKDPDLSDVEDGIDILDAGVNVFEPVKNDDDDDGDPIPSKVSSNFDICLATTIRE